MSMSDSELAAFSRRVKNAAHRGYSVALGASYAAELSAEAGVTGYTGSAADLVKLSSKVMAKRAGTTAPMKAVAPPPPPPPPPPAPVAPPPPPAPVEVVPPAPVAPPPAPVEVAAPVEVTDPVEVAAPVEVTDPVEEPIADAQAPTEPPPDTEPAAEDYSTWTKNALLEEADRREIEGHGRMNKGQLIAALMAADKAAV